MRITLSAQSGISGGSEGGCPEITAEQVALSATVTIFESRYMSLAKKEKTISKTARVRQYAIGARNLAKSKVFSESFVFSIFLPFE